MFKDFYLNFELTSENAKMPTRAHDTDAGCDVYSPQDVVIYPSQDALIPLDLRSEFSEGYALVFFNKSGVCTKKKLVIGACVDPTTLIETDKGLFTALELTKEFIDKNDILILSYNSETKTKEYKEFDGFRISNNTDCVEIEFEDGDILRCSRDHKIYTQNGWEEATELKEGQLIIT